MKAQIHPTYFEEALMVCACGNTFKTGSTREELHVQLCYKCHPFYTGQQKFVDTASLIDKFEKKRKEAKPLKVKASRGESDDNQPKTLKEMLMQLKKQQ
jgi:large subunit ribosomal protein L31